MHKCLQGLQGWLMHLRMLLAVIAEAMLQL